MRIRKVISFVAIIFCTYEVPAQKNRIELEVSTQEIGKWQDSSKVEAMVYAFNLGIKDYSYDSIHNTLVFQLQNLKKDHSTHPFKGEIVTIDAQTNKLLWSKTVNYRNTAYRTKGHLIFETTENSNPFTTCWHNLTGEKLWENEGNIVLTSGDGKIGFGIKKIQINQSLISNVMFGIDLETGVILWTKSINLNNGLFPYIPATSDSSVIVLSNGLHHINLKDGKGWSVDIQSTKSAELSKVIVGNVVYPGYGSITQDFVKSDIIRNVHSNILLKDDFIYFASVDYLLKIDIDGDIVFKKELPQKLTSMSSLTLSKDENQIYLLNYGRANVGYRSVSIGEPFIANFDSKDCNLLYIQPLFPNEESIVTSYRLGDYHLVCASTNSVVKITLDSGQYIKSDPLQKEYNNQFVVIPNHFSYVALTNRAFTKLNTRVDQIVDAVSTNFKENDWFQLNEDLEIIDSERNSNLLVWRFLSGEYEILFEDPSKQFIAIDKNNREQARFKGSLHHKEYRNLIFYSNGNQFFILNTNQFVEKKL